MNDAKLTDHWEKKMKIESNYAYQIKILSRFTFNNKHLLSTSHATRYLNFKIKP